MQKEHFDYIVIGGGSGGYAAASKAREVFKRVAIVDGAEELGGLCILRGCMPSKTLIYSAEVLHLAQKGEDFGLEIPKAKVDMKRLHQRKLSTIDEFATYRKEQLKGDRFTLFRSQAKFTGPNTIVLRDGTELSADYFMVATGSVVAVPTIPGLGNVPFWTSDDILELDFIPEKVIVLGGGIVACELAQFLRRIGSEVVQIQRSPHILKETSPEAASSIEKQFRAEGIELYTETQLQKVTHQSEGFRVEFSHKERSITTEAPYLLNALGRKPATEGLGLELAGVEQVRSGHIKCNAYQQSSNPKIYACGDVAGPYEIVHVAILQGELAALHATSRSAEPIDYDSLLRVVFTDPQIAQVGPSEQELVDRNIDYLSADYPFDDHGKSILMEAKSGYVKVMAERSTGRVLAAECVGKDGGELAHSLAVAVSLKANVHDLLNVHWYHPTLSEIWSYPLEEIAEQINRSQSSK